jgi:hypothetical protein
MSIAIHYEGLDHAIRRFSDLEADLRRDATRDLRERAWPIAQDLAVEVREVIRSSSAPQARAVAETVRPKRDRVPLVRVGATIPKLSGFRRGSKHNRAAKVSVAYGVEFGGAGGHRDGPGNVDLYRGGGHALTGALTRLTVVATETYREQLFGVMRRYGMV